MNPGLYIIGTPIGNLEDITLRALDVLKRVDLIVAEDTRHTRKLLSRYDIHTPLASSHKYNEAARAARVVRRIRDEGQAVGLVSDAGMPAVSDPGARMVSACREEGLRVEVIPGPSSVTAAVALSGLCRKGFFFEGFLPHKSGARKRRLAELADLDVPLVLFESPYRVLKLLDEVEEVLGERDLFVGRELTKQFEESLCGPPAAVREAFAGRSLKGEFVVMVDRVPPRGRARD